MNMQAILLTALAALCLPCAAEEIDPFAPPPPTPPTELSSIPTIIPSVNFEATTLPEAIEFLSMRAMELGGADLNIVLSPGLETLRIPSLRLKNATVSEILKIVAKLIGLEFEEVLNDKGDQRVALIVRGNPVPPTAAAPTPTRNGEALPPQEGDVGVLAEIPAPPKQAGPQKKVFFLEFLRKAAGESENARSDRARQTEKLEMFINNLDAKAKLLISEDLGLIAIESTEMQVIEQVILELRSNAPKPKEKQRFNS